uniref:Uncharacterized protein n=1 Tax=Tanacetum cinerariifolium TaxID=118510 RepID=A0A6L2P0X8_TANCI|nr:hypothetical protein [Tanacetum cinerariifolium]
MPEFTSEYGISKDLHPKLPSPEEWIVDFPEGKANGTEDQGQETVAPEVPPLENVKTTGVAPEAGLAEELAAMGPRVIKERRKKGNDGSTVRGKSLTSMGLGTGSTFPVPTSQETPADVNDPDPLSFVNPQCSKGAAVVGDLESENSSFTSMVGSPESIYQPEWGVTSGCHLDATKACQDLVDHKAPPSDRRSQMGYWARVALGGYEYGKANLDLEAIEAYDMEADTKYVAALLALRDLKYPMMDQLESLKDALIDVIMASLHLESDVGEDAPQWIRELQPSSSQLKILVYPEKNRCWVVRRTHGVGSAHHARSDGVSVLVPTVAPQCLAILLADVATQTETSEDGAFAAMYNLD